MILTTRLYSSFPVLSNMTTKSAVRTFLLFTKQRTSSLDASYRSSSGTLNRIISRIHSLSKSLKFQRKKQTSYLGHDTFHIHDCTCRGYHLMTWGMEARGQEVATWWECNGVLWSVLYFQWDSLIFSQLTPSSLEKGCMELSATTS